jgi:Transposase DDE domain
VVGLVIGREGFPLAHEIFAGNVQDRKTLGIMLDRLKTQVGLAPGATVVVDRGMAYADNLQEIHDRAADGRRSGPPDPQSNHPRTGAHGTLPATEHPGRNHSPPQDLEHPSSG